MPYMQSEAVPETLTPTDEWINFCEKWKDTPYVKQTSLGTYLLNLRELDSLIIREKILDELIKNIK